MFYSAVYRGFASAKTTKHITTYYSPATEGHYTCISSVGGATMFKVDWGERGGGGGGGGSVKKLLRAALPNFSGRASLSRKRNKNCDCECGSREMAMT